VVSLTLLNFIQKIVQIDLSLFKKINGQWHTPFFDVFLPFTREPYFWLPFYFFLILFTTINFGKRGWYWVLFLITLALISDFISSTVIKGSIMRLRPCRDPVIADQVRFLVRTCGLNSSFVSSHACNFITFKKQLGNRWAFIFLWAFIPSYAQIYVGVHFPMDVFCGIIVGLAIGYMGGRVFNGNIGLMLPETEKQL
jgi:membrane-associated phospholipid phosphatase